jgi:hypothetical protein
VKSEPQACPEARVSPVNVIQDETGRTSHLCGLALESA